MCGTILEPARRANATLNPPAVAVSTPASPPTPRSETNYETMPAMAIPPVPQRNTVLVSPVRSSGNVPPISGPSLLGLDSSTPAQSSELEDLRDRAFSGLASYGGPEEPRSAGKEVLLTLLLLAALGGAGWWTYKNYIRASGYKAIPVAGINNEPTENTANNSAPKPVDKPDTKQNPVASTEPPAEKTSTPAAASPEENEPAREAKQPEKANAEDTPKPETPAPISASQQVKATRTPAPKPEPPADTGDAFFRRGESFLYGRNGAQDCGNAIKYLKMASEKQHAKARSMMGTMYATGHCVPRDLPNSYRWFALALQADPNNSVLEKDLGAVWNQMTPPERQMATKRQ
jgi:hypothetical protein